MLDLELESSETSASDATRKSPRSFIVGRVSEAYGNKYLESLGS